MASILKPFSNLLGPGPLQVPTGALAIDWSHPLANGLMVYDLPGVTLLDVCGFSAPLVLFGASTMGISSEGPALDLTTNNASNGGDPGVTLPGQSGVTAQSLYVRGYAVGAPVNTTGLIGGTGFSAPTNNSPFFTFAIQFNSSTTTFKTSWLQVAGTLGQHSFAGSISQPSPLSIGATIKDGGNTTNYLNGLQDSQAAGVSFKTATGSFIMGGNINAQLNVGAMWSRELSAAEMLAMHLDPYGLLIPAEYEMPTIPFIAPPVVVMLGQIQL